MQIRPRTALNIALRRQKELDRIASYLDDEWEYCPDRPALVVRRLSCAEYVARITGRLVSPQLLGDVALAARKLDWDPVVLANRRFFRGVKRRDVTLSQALTESKDMRRGARE